MVARDRRAPPPSRGAVMKEVINVIMEKAIEYGLNVNEKKSKVVRIDGEFGRRRRKMGKSYI